MSRRPHTDIGGREAPIALSRRRLATMSDGSGALEACEWTRMLTLLILLSFAYVALLVGGVHLAGGCI